MRRFVEEESIPLACWFYETSIKWSHDVPDSLAHLIHSVWITLSCHTYILLSNGCSLVCMLDLLIGMLGNPLCHFLMVALHLVQSMILWTLININEDNWGRFLDLLMAHQNFDLLSLLERKIWSWLLLRIFVHKRWRLFYLLLESERVFGVTFFKLFINLEFFLTIVDPCLTHWLVHGRGGSHNT